MVTLLRSQFADVTHEMIPRVYHQSSYASSCGSPLLATSLLRWSQQSISFMKPWSTSPARRKFPHQLETHKVYLNTIQHAENTWRLNWKTFSTVRRVTGRALPPLKSLPQRPRFLKKLPGLDLKSRRSGRVISSHLNVFQAQFDIPVPR